MATLLAAQQNAAPAAPGISQSPPAPAEAQAPLPPAEMPSAAPTPVSPQQGQPAASTPATPAQETSGQNSPAPPEASQSNAAAKPAIAGTSATAGDTAAPQPAILPTVTKREAAEAKRQFEAGVKLKSKGHLDAAFDKFSSASELDPRNISYVTAREFTRQELALQALKQGNKAMQDKDEIVAMADFRRALDYDPSNDYALQRLRDAMPEPVESDQKVTVTEQSAPIELQPDPKHQDFHFRGDSRALITEVARAYGITAEFEDSVKQQRVHYDIQDVNFATAMRTANEVTKTFWITLSPTQIFVLADTVENRRNFERMGLRIFYLPDLNDQQLTEMTNALRVLLNLRFISFNKGHSAIVIRAELPVLDAADKLIRSLTTGRPEVLLDISVYAVSTSLARSLGTALPTQFTLFNISPALLTQLGPNSQNLINQLISSGGINQANSTAISALLAQLANSTASSILSQPFVTFGGGLTLFGLTGGGTGISPTFSLNSSEIRGLEHVTLRASHNDPAVMKIGERYPIINATFAPIFNTPSIAQVIGNNTFAAPFPSFNFEDLGLILKATPLIHGDQDVSMKLELQLRSLGATNVNGIPIINNREYSGNITVKDGEASVVTGMIDMNDSRSINGYPFLGQVPGLGYGASVHDKNVTQDELLVVITPHILRVAEHASFAVELPLSH
jgi:hypothetical protein